jgi:hypothetical protein
MPEYYYTNKCTNVSVSYITYDTISYVDKETKLIIRGLDGAPVRRTVKLTNRLVSFSYAIPTKQIDYLYKIVGTVNSTPVNLGGMSIYAHGAKLISYSTEKIKSHDHNDYTGIELTIEIGDQKDLYKTEMPLEGFYCKHPVLNNIVRIQHSSDPSYFLNNRDKYPSAFTLWNGYGFYSEDRPDLNIVEPFPLTTDGSMNISDVIYTKTVVDSDVCNWGILCLPREGLV